MTNSLLVQHWLLQDIAPMHRALIRRLASNKLLELTEDSNRKILWTVRNGSDPAPLPPERYDVLWIPSPSNLLVQAEIRLLWRWPPEIYRDFHFHTSWNPTGVVYNLLTLQAWIDRALLFGNWTQTPSCPTPHNRSTTDLLHPRLSV